MDLMYIIILPSLILTANAESLSSTFTPQTLQEQASELITTESSVAQPPKNACLTENEIPSGLFSLHPEALTWFEAMRACWREGAQLATPRSPREALALTDLLLAAKGVASDVMRDALHVGVQNIAGGSDWHTLDGFLLSEAGFNLWLQGGEGECGALLAIGRYIRHPCHTRTPFACERRAAEAVHPKNEYVAVGDAGRFRLHEQPLPWALALRCCQAEGATLAVPASPREAGLLAGVLFTRASAAHARALRRHGFFVGVMDVAREGEWRTVYGNTLKEAGYESWAPGQPSGGRRENCGTMLGDGRFADYPCMAPMPFCCQENTAPRDSEDLVEVHGRYRLHKKPLPWFDALQACQRENASLVSVTSREEEEFVRNLLGAPVPNSYMYFETPDAHSTSDIHVAIYDIFGNKTWIRITDDEESAEDIVKTYKRDDILNESAEPAYYDENHSSSYRVPLTVNSYDEYNHYHSYDRCVVLTRNTNFRVISCSKAAQFLCKHKM